MAVALRVWKPIPKPETAAAGKRIYEAPRSGPAEPVREAADMRRIREYLLASSPYGRRNWMIFLFGAYTGRRCGDVLKLRVGDVMRLDGTIRGTVRYAEQKTKVKKSMHLNEFLRGELAEYIRESNLKTDDYLFPSRKSHGNKAREKDGRDVSLPNGMMSTDSYGKILRAVRRDLELKFQLSTHSMRKTCGYNIFNQTHSLEAARDALGQRSTEVTKRYIGSYEDHVAGLYDELKIAGVDNEEV